MERSQIARGPGVNWGLSRSRSQVIRSYWVHLWCSPSAGCNQSVGSLYNGAPVPLLRWLCVFRGVNTITRLSAFSVWGENLGRVFEISFFWPGSVRSVSVTPTSPSVSHTMTPVLKVFFFFWRNITQMKNNQFKLKLKMSTDIFPSKRFQAVLLLQPLSQRQLDRDSFPNSNTGQKHKFIQSFNLY